MVSRFQDPPMIIIISQSSSSPPSPLPLTVSFTCSCLAWSENPPSLRTHLRVPFCPAHDHHHSIVLTFLHISNFSKQIVIIILNWCRQIPFLLTTLPVDTSDSILILWIILPVQTSDSILILSGILPIETSDSILILSRILLLKTLVLSWSCWQFFLLKTDSIQETGPANQYAGINSMKQHRQVCCKQLHQQNTKELFQLVFAKIDHNLSWSWTSKIEVGNSSHSAYFWKGRNPMTISALVKPFCGYFVPLF
jgi:hypothetical protein